MLDEFPAIEGQLDAFDRANPLALVLGGEWDFALNGTRPAGRAALWREGGDLVLGKLPLGLGEARLQATLGAGRLAVNGQAVSYTHLDVYKRQRSLPFRRMRTPGAA